MYVKKIEKCDITCSLPPSPVRNCHTFSDHFPFKRDVLYGRRQCSYMAARVGFEPATFQAQGTTESPCPNSGLFQSQIYILAYPAKIILHTGIASLCRGM